MSLIDGFQLPKDWRSARLGDLLDEQIIRCKEEPEFESYPILSLTKNSGLIPQADRFKHRVARTNVDDYKIVREGWIVYNPMVLWEGAIYALRSSGSGVVSPVYAVWRARGDSVDWRYLDYLLRSRPLLTEYERLASGVVKRRRVVRKTAFQAIEVPLPSIEEQQAIARILDAIRSAIAQTAQVVEATRALKRSLTTYLFTYGSVPIEDADSVPLQGDSETTRPASWDVMPLKDVLVDGPRNGIYKRAAEYGSGVPIVRINDFGLDGDVITDAPSRVRLEESELRRFGLQPSDLLLNRVNSLSHLGKVAMIGETSEPMAFESNMMRLRPDQNRVLPEYLLRYLSSPWTRASLASRSKRAVAQSSINQSDVESLVCPIPPLAEQQRIAAVLASLDRKIAAELRSERALQSLGTSLENDLITARLRVDPRATAEL